MKSGLLATYVLYRFVSTPLYSTPPLYRIVTTHFQRIYTLSKPIIAQQFARKKKLLMKDQPTFYHKGSFAYLRERERERGKGSFKSALHDWNKLHFRILH